MNENLREMHIEVLAEEIDRLRATIERLREYAGHKDVCDLQFYSPEPKTCDCGYDALMVEVEESK